MLAFAMHDARSGGFFQRAERQESFHKNFQQLDEAAIFLHGYDERFVLVAEMIFHELRGLPIFQFAFGGGGAALGLGSFLSDLFEVLVGIESGFGADGRFEIGRRFFVGMRERPLENAMNDEIGIATNGRSEMGVLIEAQREVAEGIGGVARLFEGTQH